MDEFKKFLNYGLSVVPVGEDKLPLCKWKQYQSEIATAEQFDEWQTTKKNKIMGFAIVCGVVSGGVICLDFDNHQNDAEKRFAEWKKVINDNMPGLAEKLIIEKTKNGGFHAIFRCKNYEIRNAKLAQVIGKDGRNDAVIETRGEGGYVVVAPSKGYSLIQNDFSGVPELTTEETNLLIAVSKLQDEIKTPESNKQEENNTTFTDKVTTGISPFDEYNNNGDHVRLLQSLGWKMSQSIRENGRQKEYWIRPGKSKGHGGTWNYMQTPNRFYCFTANGGQLEQGKMYSNTDLRMIIEGIPDNATGRKRIVKILSGEGFGVITTKTVTATATAIKDNEITERKTDKVKKFKAKFDADADVWIHEPNENIDLPDNCIFWEVLPVSTEQTPKLKINYKGYLNMLRNVCRFFQYKINDKDYELIQIKNNIIDLATTTNIKQEVDKILNKLPNNINSESQPIDKDVLINYMLGISKTTVNGDLLKSINVVDLDEGAEFDGINVYPVWRDTKTVGCKPFKNGIAKMVKDNEEIEMIPYENAKYSFWRNSIIKRDFNLIKDMKVIVESQIAVFIKNVCTPESKRTENKGETNVQKMMSLMSVIGYMQRTFFDPTVPKIPILTEEKIGEDSSEANGRTGKSLILNMLQETTDTCIINAKDWRGDDPFKLDSYRPGQTIIAIDDLPQGNNFNLEDLFSASTMGLTINPKGKRKFYIPPEKSPKFIITSNYAVAINSDSAEDRVANIEFSDYYSKKYRPTDEPGVKGLFFSEVWNEKDENGITEWDKFYNFMLGCELEYLNKGLVEYELVNLKQRELNSKVITDVQDFCEYAIEQANKETIKKIGIDNLWNNYAVRFISADNTEKRLKNATKRNLKMWMSAVLKFKNIKYEYKKIKINGQAQWGWYFI